MLDSLSPILYDKLVNENTNTNQLPSQEPKKNALLEKVEFGVGGILLGVGTFLLMLFVLNYFNIVSLSQVFPNQLDWLPHRPAAQGVPSGTLPTSQGEALQSQSASPTPIQSGPTPTPPLVANLETCNVTKEGNPLVVDVQTLPNGTIVGDFRGNINKTTFNSQRTEASIELISQKGEQTHTFNLKDEEGLVYDVTLGKDLKLSDLSAGQTVTMSFNCFKDQSQEKQFKITRISITGKL